MLSAADLLSNPKPIRWLVRDMLEADTLAMIFGDPGSAKSFLALDMAACIATGKPFHGHRTTAGAVAYLAGEGHAGIARRLAAWRIKFGKEIDSAPLYISSRAAPLPNSEADLCDALSDALGNKPDELSLIVVDTIARHLVGDENTQADAGRFVDALDRLRMRYPGATILAVHHTGHGDKQRARGSTVFRAAVDAEMKVEKNTSHIVTIECTKSKDALPFENMAFSLRTVELPKSWADEDGNPATSAILSPCEVPTSKAPARKLGVNQSKALAVLRELSAKALDSWVDVTDWQAASDMSRKRFPEVLEGLKVREAIEMKDGLARAKGNRR